MGRPAAGHGIDVENFIIIWIEAYKTGKNQSDIARQLGVTPAAVSVKAKKLRASGVELPDLSRNTSGLSVNAAKSLVSKLLGEVEKEELAKEAAFENVDNPASEEDLIF